MQLSHRVLAVDDNPTNLVIIEEALQGRFSVRTAEDGAEALRLAPAFRPDVVLLDVMMPAPDGYEVCSRMKNDRAMGPTHVIMVSAKTDLDSRLRAYQAGADDYVLKPFSEEELYAKVCVNVRNKTIYGVIRSQLEALCGAAGEALELVSHLRDAETAGHLVRMRDYSQILAGELRSTAWGRAIDDQFLEDLYRASPLHDVGKVAIPDAILRKPDRLTDEEFEQMKLHTVCGERIIRKLAQQQPSVSMFQMAVEVARWHHENFDGTGYPDALAGDAIPMAARIVRVADVFDAITSARPYKRKQSPEEARDLIVAAKRSAFDPAVVDAMLHVFDELAEMALVADEMDGAPAESLRF
jgi:putative two-component system response regulator